MYTQEPIKIFVVEDDPVYTKFIEYVLSLNPDFEVTTFQNGKSVLDRLHEQPNIITLDYSLPDMTGEEVLRKIKNIDPNIVVVVVSSQEKIGTAIKLLKDGAYDYIIKDEDTKERLLNTINNARSHISLTKEIDHLKQQITEKYEFGNSIIGNSSAIKGVFSLLEKAVKTNISVSITGETGTGKEVAAKAIHYNSKRKKKPFVAVNIAAIPKDLIESELFGHEKGAFTGAATRRVGKFEEAENGTILLDEIGEMDLNLQAKLLRVIQEKELTRIGGNEVIPLNFRLIVATHKDLGEEVKKGNFREDLYYRLLGLPIHLPPLREREGDILLLSKFFLERFTKDNDLPKMTLSNEVQTMLLGYTFPGNIRELKSIIELAAVMANNHEITTDDISFNNVSGETSYLVQEMTMKEYSFKIIKHYLKKYNDNVIKTAEKLDVGKSTIYRYLKEMEKHTTQNEH